MSKKVDIKSIIVTPKNICIMCLMVYVLTFLSYIFILGYFFGVIYAPEYYRPFFICGIFLVISLVFYRYMNIRRIKEEVERQNIFLRNQYSVLQEVYDGNAKLYHDFHNHINVIYHLIEKENFDEAKKYIGKISEPVREISELSLTGSDVVDIVIHSKKRWMEQNNIKLKVNVEFPTGTHISSYDMCIILSNLLDNAMESAMELSEFNKTMQSPEVDCIIRRVQGFLFVKIVNPCKMKSNKLFYTTKKDVTLHGFGLQNVKNTVDKYNGTFNIECENSRCEVLIMIPL